MIDKRASSDEPDIAAAEYALGLLTGEELRSAWARAGSDPVFAADVARWQGRLAPLLQEVDAVAPPADLWRRIEAAASGRSASNDNVVGLHRRLNRWRAATGAMTALAASLALLLAFGPHIAVVPTSQIARPARAPLVAMLGDQGAVKVVASWDPAARQLVLAVPGDLPADPQHARELWVIPSGGKPHSLGTMPAAKQMHVRLAQAVATLLQHGATIAISIEPPGGSPTGTPTGPVIASGALTKA